MHRMDSQLLTRVVLRNYRSIPACDVGLGPLTFLVGPNGAGKSNFLDAIRFVADALRHSLDYAIRDRGGIGRVRRRSNGHPTRFGIRVDVSLAGAHGSYAFEVGGVPGGGYSVLREECVLSPTDPSASVSRYRVDKGIVRESTLDPTPTAASNRLYLVSVSGTTPFQALHEALSETGVHDLDPSAIRELRAPRPGERLNRDGSNLTSILSAIEAHSPETKARIEEYLTRIVPGSERVSVTRSFSGEMLELVQGESPDRVAAGHMSDGTLRALGVLVALFHGDGSGPLRLVAIENPDAGLHPASAGVLCDVLRDASTRSQVLVTSHSPDLLDEDGFPVDSILAVASRDGDTVIGPIDEACRMVLEEHRFTAGELLRLGQLEPDPDLARPRRGPFDEAST